MLGLSLSLGWVSFGLVYSQEFTQNMSTKCHPKNVHKKSPKKRTFCGHFCPQYVAKSVHEMSPLLVTKCHLLCPRDVCQPPYWPNFSDIFDLCFHWVPVVCGIYHSKYKLVIAMAKSACASEQLRALSSVQFCFAVHYIR